jgi:hypothetical protein
MKKELVLEIARMNQLMINEAIEPAAIKFVKSVIKEFPFEYKKLFTAFGAEEEQAMKTLEKRSAKAAEVETAVEKLLLKVNWGELANSLLKNKKLGGALDAFIEGKMKNVASGLTTREEALRDIESVVETWTRNQGVPELGPELVKKLEQKLPDVGGVLNQEVEELFRLTGKKLSTADAELLNNVYKKLFKLKPEEIIQVESALKRITGLNGELQQAITKLRQAGDMASKIKADKLEQTWNAFVDNVNKASAATGKLKVRSIFIAITTLFGVYLLVLFGQGLWKLKNEIESFSIFGYHPFGSGGGTSEPNNNETPPETW